MGFGELELSNLPHDAGVLVTVKGEKKRGKKKKKTSDKHSYLIAFQRVRRFALPWPLNIPAFHNPAQQMGRSEWAHTSPAGLQQTLTSASAKPCWNPDAPKHRSTQSPFTQKIKGATVKETKVWGQNPSAPAATEDANFWTDWSEISKG